MSDLGALVTRLHATLDTSSEQSFTVDGARLDEAVDALGPPGSIVDGPALRWYGSAARLEVRARNDDRLRVYVEPMPDSEDEENRAFEWGELPDVPYLWRADRDDLLPDGLYLTGGLLTEELQVVLDQFPDVVRSLQRAAVLLPGLIGSPTWILGWPSLETTFVQGYFTHEATALEVWNEGACAHEALIDAAPEAADGVITVILDAIRASEVTSPDELTWTLFANGSDYRLGTRGLGLEQQ